MPTNTTFLGLKTYNSTTDGSALFTTFRADLAGVSPTSNMNLIDTFASSTSGSIAILSENKPVVPISASYVSANYYEATSSSITSYTNDAIISLKLNVTSNGTVTLKINALTTVSLQKVDSSGSLVNLENNNLLKNKEYLFRYNGSSWVWVSSTSADQISISGNNNNLVAISGCVIVDSGITTSGTKISSSAIPLGSGLVNTSGCVVVNTGSTLALSGGSVILATTGVVSGSYGTVSVDPYGRIVSGSPSSSSGHIIANSGSSLPTRTILNFQGSGVTASDNSGSGRTDVTINGADVLQNQVFS